MEICINITYGRRVVWRYIYIGHLTCRASSEEVLQQLQCVIYSSVSLVMHNVNTKLRCCRSCQRTKECGSFSSINGGHDAPPSLHKKILQQMRCIMMNNVTLLNDKLKSLWSCHPYKYALCAASFFFIATEFLGVFSFFLHLQYSVWISLPLKGRIWHSKGPHYGI